MITLTKKTFVGVYCITVLPNGLGQIDHNKPNDNIQGIFPE
jgi:hypothetical protein